MGTEGMDAQTGGSLAISGAVIDKQCFFGEGLLTTKHHLEYLGSGFHDAAFVTEVHVVEEVAYWVALTIEVCSSPHHHKWIGVGEQTYLVALVAQQTKHVEVALRHMVHIAVPGVVTVCCCEFSANHSTEFLSECFCVDATRLEISENAALLESIKTLSCIVQSDAFKLTDGSIQTQGKHYATQVECDVDDFAHRQLFVVVDDRVHKVHHRLGGTEHTFHLVEPVVTLEERIRDGMPGAVVLLTQVVDV